jgi:hypothetical protein
MGSMRFTKRTYTCSINIEEGIQIDEGMDLQSAGFCYECGELVYKRWGSILPCFECSGCGCISMKRGKNITAKPEEVKITMLQIWKAMNRPYLDYIPFFSTISECLNKDYSITYEQIQEYGFLIKGSKVYWLGPTTQLVRRT